VVAFFYAAATRDVTKAANIVVRVLRVAIGIHLETLFVISCKIGVNLIRRNHLAREIIGRLSLNHLEALGPHELIGILNALIIKGVFKVLEIVLWFYAGNGHYIGVIAFNICDCIVEDFAWLVSVFIYYGLKRWRVALESSVISVTP
jgi:hypothetical protein